MAMRELRRRRRRLLWRTGPAAVCAGCRRIRQGEIVRGLASRPALLGCMPSSDSPRCMSVAVPAAALHRRELIPIR